MPPGGLGKDGSLCPYRATPSNRFPLRWQRHRRLVLSFPWKTGGADGIALCGGSQQCKNHRSY